jgi:hypothetical protein
VLSGPSYQPSFDVNNASCWETGPSVNGVAADAAGDVVGAGHDINGYANPSLYFFPPTQPGAVQSKPNFVLMDAVNNDPSLTSCIPSAPSATGCLGSLVDAVVASSANSAGVGIGDMLVLVGDAGSTSSAANPVVLRFPAAAIQTAKAYASNCATSFGNTTGTPPACVTNSHGSQLVTQLTLGLALNDSPVSMDISPIDGSLFIATNQGNIYQLTPTSTGYVVNPLPYAVNEYGIQQMRLGQLNGTLYVLATILVGDPATSVDMYVGSPPTGTSFQSPAVSAAVSDAYPIGLAVQSPTLQAPSSP